MPISPITPTNAVSLGSEARERSFLATFFGAGIVGFRRKFAPDVTAEPVTIAHPQGEAWAAALARGDQRKVGRRNPYAVNHDIEALYASARAAGGATAFDLGDEVVAVAALSVSSTSAGRKR